MPDPSAEIREILFSHAGQPVDYVALFMFLNTVAGGHYEERYSEAEIGDSLRQLLASGEVEAWTAAEVKLQLHPETFVPGETTCHFRLRQN